jgi:hypothetical protein
MAPTIPAAPGPMGEASPSGSRLGRVRAKLIDEFFHILYPTLYFIVGFNLIELSTNLILAQYLIHLTNLLLATTSALIVGKAVLVADKMPFIRRFDAAPLIQPILFKTIVYWAFVFVARLLEAIIGYAFEHGTLAGFAAYMATQFSWHRFVFIQLWILVLFLIYVTSAEFNALFGQGEVRRLLFTQGSTELKLARRQRIRALVRLSHFAAGYTAAELQDPASAAHHRCLGMIAALAAVPGHRPRNGQQLTANDSTGPRRRPEPSPGQG